VYAQLLNMGLKGILSRQRQREREEEREYSVQRVFWVKCTESE
jgi:hypothetical protein